MDKWTNFFICVAAASATLTGLIFVGVSLSLTRILSLPKLASRALNALILLINIVIIAALSLVPQNLFCFGIELSVSVGITWIVTLWLDIDVLKATAAPYKPYARWNIVFTQISVLPYITGSIFILSGNNCGMYWVVAGIIFSIIKAILDAWILLIEIHR